MKTVIKKIQNWTDLVSALADRMLQADIDCNQYQTDIYLYVNDDGSWELEDFVNVGGNSWLQDNHITVWRDQEHLENWSDWYQTIREFSDMLDMSEDDLKQTVLDWFNSNDDGITLELSDIYYSDVVKYLKSDDTEAQQMAARLKSSYIDYLKELYPNYLQSAEELLLDAIEVSEND